MEADPAQGTVFTTKRTSDIQPLLNEHLNDNAYLLDQVLNHRNVQLVATYVQMRKRKLCRTSKTTRSSNKELLKQNLNYEFVYVLPNAELR